MVDPLQVVKEIQQEQMPNQVPSHRLAATLLVMEEIIMVVAHIPQAAAAALVVLSLIKDPHKVVEVRADIQEMAAQVWSLVLHLQALGAEAEEDPTPVPAAVWAY
jgi:hypothetical protein